MTQRNTPDAPDASTPDASFGDILSQFEQAHHARGETVEGTIVSVTPDGAFVDIGRKMDGVLPPDPKIELKPGMKVLVSIRGRDGEGNYLLSTIKVEIPRDWSGLEAAFAEKRTIARHGARSGEGRPARGCGCARVHAGIAQRRERSGGA